jgi:hypothetical protein
MIAHRFYVTRKFCVVVRCDVLMQQVDGSQDLPFMPPKRGKLYMVPNGIRPVMRRTAVEVLILIFYKTETLAMAFCWVQVSRDVCLY